jgi:hypothetical protein
LSLDIFTSEHVQAGGPYLAVPTLSCRANGFPARLLYNVARPRRNFAQPRFHAAMILYGHDIAALKS